MNLNRKGFTIVETLAVVVILTIIMAIMVPNVSKLIKKNQDDRLEDLKNSIISAAKIYLSDYKYEVEFDVPYYNYKVCETKETIENIKKINGEELYNSCLRLKTLVEKKYLNTNKNENVKNPLKNNEHLDIDSTCIPIKYSCDKKKFIFDKEQLKLQWEEEMIN